MHKKSAFTDVTLAFVAWLLERKDTVLSDVDFSACACCHGVQEAGHLL